VDYIQGARPALGGEPDYPEKTCCTVVIGEFSRPLTLNSEWVMVIKTLDPDSWKCWISGLNEYVHNTGRQEFNSVSLRTVVPVPQISKYREPRPISKFNKFSDQEDHGMAAVGIEPMILPKLKATTELPSFLSTAPKRNSFVGCPRQGPSVHVVGWMPSHFNLIKKFCYLRSLIGTERLPRARDCTVHFRTCLKILNFEGIYLSSVKCHGN
jgi:hypothetical protein